MIKAARTLGLGLDEVAELLEADGTDTTRPGRLQDRTEAELADLERKIADLKVIRDSLFAARDAGCDDLVQCAGSPCCRLPFIRTVTRAETSDRSSRSLKNRHIYGAGAAAACCAAPIPRPPGIAGAAATVAMFVSPGPFSVLWSPPARCSPLLPGAEAQERCCTLAALNLCRFAMLPAYLSLLVVGDRGAAPASAVVTVGRTVLATVLMTVGVVAVFGVFGLALTPVRSIVPRRLPVVTAIIGVLLAGLGAVLLAGRSLILQVPFPRLVEDPVSVRSRWRSTRCPTPWHHSAARSDRSLLPPRPRTATATMLDGTRLRRRLGLVVVGVPAIAAAPTIRTVSTTLWRLSPYLSQRRPVDHPWAGKSAVRLVRATGLRRQ